jgi:hypothetical protein
MDASDRLFKEIGACNVGASVPLVQWRLGTGAGTKTLHDQRFLRRLLRSAKCLGQRRK